MGIDARLKALEEVTDEELAAAHEFMAARGCDEWPIRRVRHYPDPWGSIESCPSLEISMSQRLYTETIPRGHWPRIHEVIVTARAALPSVEWHYCSDLDEGLGQPVTDELLAALWARWLDGPDPHHGYFR